VLQVAQNCSYKVGSSVAVLLAVMLKI